MAMRKNLILIPDTDHHNREDFDRIAQHITAQAPDISPLVLTATSWHRNWPCRLRLALRPTLVVGMRAFGSTLRPLRGTCHQGESLSKSATYRRMESVGLPVIPWCPWTATTPIDPAQMGEYVISKPDIGRRGQSVKVRATRKLHFDAEKHGQEPLLLQAFIYTGPWPVVHRVLTLYGEPLLHWRSEYRQSQPCHDPQDPRQVAGHNPVASHRNAHVTLVRDPDIEACATRVARRAFSTIPLLGFDILRDARDGSLHVCEVNPWGQTWHFSSTIGRAMQRDHGLHFESQFNAFEKAADIFIRQCRECAR